MAKNSSQGRVNAVGVVLLAMAYVVCMLQQAEGAVVVRKPVLHMVGGSGVWTIGSKVSYTRWAASKFFRVNDVLLFKYPVTFHNVVQVSQAEYLQCKIRKPLAVYRNGMARVKLAKKGTYFFICGVPGHCQAGMKMALTVS
ncbi:hypothetical protein L7F22_016018 [Adiantum nelumboides]|nr:hypothetical protein [Adiantum nelumboides]